jgi:hypothetical protein
MHLAGIFQRFFSRGFKQKSAFFWEPNTQQEEWPKHQPSEAAFTLRHWPEINATMKNANTYRALSLLSHGPVNFENLRRCMRGSVTDAVFLLQYLDRQDVLNIVRTEWKVSDQTLKQTLGEKWLH